MQVLKICTGLKYNTVPMFFSESGKFLRTQCVPKCIFQAKFNISAPTNGAGKSTDRKKKKFFLKKKKIFFFKPNENQENCASENEKFGQKQERNLPVQGRGHGDEDDAEDHAQQSADAQNEVKMADNEISVVQSGIQPKIR